jgi:hypothetical protein
LISVETEIIQCAKANRVGVLILRKGLAVPRNEAAGLSYSPGGAAVSLVVEGAVVCPARFLRRRMKAGVAYVCSSAHWDAKRLNTTIKVLVVQRILVMPYARNWVGHFVTHEPDPIVCRIRLVLVHGGACACPCLYGRLHPNGVPSRGKCESGWAAADSELTI